MRVHIIPSVSRRVPISGIRPWDSIIQRDGSPATVIEVRRAPKGMRVIVVDGPPREWPPMHANRMVWVAPRGPG